MGGIIGCAPRSIEADADLCSVLPAGVAVAVRGRGWCKAPKSPSVLPPSNLEEAEEEGPELVLGLEAKVFEPEFCLEAV
jgi:hypothetical protein